MKEQWWELYGHYSMEIKPAVIAGSTDKTVLVVENVSWNKAVPVFKERRRALVSDYSAFFPTWDEAHAEMVKRLEQRAHNAQCSLDEAKLKLASAKEMKAPA